MACYLNWNINNYSIRLPQKLRRTIQKATLLIHYEILIPLSFYSSKAEPTLDIYL